VAVVEWWPLWRGGRCGEVAVVERWPLWSGGCCGEVAGVERWPVWRGGRCGEVAVSGGSTVVTFTSPPNLALKMQILIFILNKFPNLKIKTLHGVPDLFAGW